MQPHFVPLYIYNLTPKGMTMEFRDTPWKSEKCSAWMFARPWRSTWSTSIWPVMFLHQNSFPICSPGSTQHALMQWTSAVLLSLAAAFVSIRFKIGDVAVAGNCNTVRAKRRAIELLHDMTDFSHVYVFLGIAQLSQDFYISVIYSIVLCSLWGCFSLRCTVMVLQGSGKHHPKSFEIQGQNISEHNMSFSVYTLKFIEEWNEILPELRGVVQLRLVFVQQVHGKLLHGPEIHKKNACRWSHSLCIDSGWNLLAEKSE